MRLQKFSFIVIQRNFYQFYYQKVHWQFTRLPIQLHRAWRNFSLEKWFEKLRWLWVLLTGVGIVWWLFDFPSFEEFKNIFQSFIERDNPPWTLITLFLGTPTAYVIWFFRDKNNRMQIENQRKDINLKEFQRLSEWVSGQHLPENTGFESGEKKIPVETNEAFKSQKSILKSNLTKYDGAAALQIAAIYQLEAFLKGDYGNSFRRPAFQLLKSLWLSLMYSNVQAWNEVENKLKEIIDNSINKQKWDDWTENNFKLWQESFKATYSTVGQALVTVLGAKSGSILRNHSKDLQFTILAGFNHGLPSLERFELDGLNLEGIGFHNAELNKSNFQGSKLSISNFQGAYLENAKIQGAKLLFANLQMAKLNEANLNGIDFSNAKLNAANLYEARLEYASLIRANLIFAGLNNAKCNKANFMMANLFGASLIESSLQEVNLKYAWLYLSNLGKANLQFADLSSANLKVSNLEKVNLKGANLRNIEIDEKTFFEGATADQHTIIEVGEYDSKLEFVRDEVKSNALREQMERQGLEFVDD